MENTKKPKKQSLDVSNETISSENLAPVEVRHVPSNFKIGRAYLTQAPNVERTLFSDMMDKEESGYIISGLTQKVSSLDLSRFAFAIAQILYNQSYLNGNTETNSGFCQIVAKNFTNDIGRTVYLGYVEATLNEICKLMYGIDNPQTKHKRAVSALLSTLDRTPAAVTFPDGKVIKKWLCKIMELDKQSDNGAIYYKLTLNPIFCMNVGKNFAELPQDTMKRLTNSTDKTTLAHVRLMELLSFQDKRKPYTVAIDKLLQYLELWEQYKKNKKRCIDLLNSVFDSMVKIELTKSLPKNGTLGDGTLSYTFTLNPNFTKHTEETQD